jgi:iron(III) transport system ATP-binding protein
VSVKIRGLSYRYGKVEVLRSLDLTVATGEVVAVLGPSGSGKTTLLNLLAGLLAPAAGEIWIGETRVAAPGQVLPPERRRIGMVFQDFALWPHMTVRETIRFPLETARRPRDQQEARVRDLAGTVHLDGLLDRYPHELSGGQRQRVSLARALASEPALILLDEPMSNLDAKLRESLRSDLRDLLHAHGATAVYVTHDRLEAMAVADRLVILDGGRVVQEGTPERLYGEPETEFVAAFMGPASFIPVTVLPSPHGARASTDFQVEVPASGPGARAAGSRRHWLVRPEQVRFKVRAGASWEGTVRAAVFQGSHWDLVVENPDGSLLRGYHRTPAAPGERLLVSVGDTAAWLVS